jgi:hypothetical protein
MRTGKKIEEVQLAVTPLQRTSGFALQQHGD